MSNHLPALFIFHEPAIPKEKKELVEFRREKNWTVKSGKWAVKSGK
jgi:hypothetical protein